MKSVLRIALFIAATTVSALTGQAANVSFIGVLSSGTAPFATGQQYTLNIDFQPGGLTATMDPTTTLVVHSSSGTKTFEFGPPVLVLGSLTSASGSLTLDPVSQRKITIDIKFANNNAASGQPGLGNLLLEVTGSTPIGSLSETNVAAIIRPGSTVTGGLSAVYFVGGPSNVGAGMNGTIPVPEPGSIGLLAGLGCVVGRRLWRRRAAGKAPAAA